MEPPDTTAVIRAGRGRCSLSLPGPRQSVFALTPFIESADLSVPAAQWQSAAGRRLLSAEELACRQRYFNEKAEAALRRLRRPAGPGGR